MPSIFAAEDDCHSELGKFIWRYRSDRPDEWSMDEFIRGAENLAAELKSSLEARAELEIENEKLKKGIVAIRDLINESFGVDGLHQDGVIAPWDELEEGGTFEEWLVDFNQAENT